MVLKNFFCEKSDVGFPQEMFTFAPVFYEPL